LQRGTLVSAAAQFFGGSIRLSRKDGDNAWPSFRVAFDFTDAEAASLERGLVFLWGSYETARPAICVPAG
jgi:hypothetical protein